MKRAGAVLWISLVVLTVILTFWFLWWWQGNRQVSGGSCGAGDLSLSVGRTNGSAGTQYIHLVVTNKSNRTCALNGYPTVSLLDGEGSQLGSNAQQNSSFAATAVVLPPHNQAYVALGVPNANNFTTDVCSDTSISLRLYVPGSDTSSTVPLTVPMRQKVCPGFSVSVFQYGA